LGKINTGISLTQLQHERVQAMAHADNGRSVSAFVGILIDQAWVAYLEERAQAPTLSPAEQDKNDIT
jgi:hypothetical protein